MSRAHVEPGALFQDAGHTYYCRKVVIGKSATGNVWFRLLYLESICPDCGTLVRHKVGDLTKALNRRCKRCRKPGKKAKANSVFD